jgi:UDP-2-acetamido-2,6-beta-L-arabino-hexul-4-ose reductase
VATFCHQLNRGESPEIKIDAELQLIYIADLIGFIQGVIDSETNDQAVDVPSTGSLNVTELLALLQSYMNGYMKDHIIPGFNNPLEIALFNTLKSYRDVRENAAPMKVHADERGHLVEIVKEHNGGQTFFSVTKPGITRGNHFHMRKVERFCVVRGEAIIRMRKLGTGKIVEFPVSGKKPLAIDIPVFFTHNISNNGPEDALTLFWTNEIYNPKDTDTYYVQV